VRDCVLAGTQREGELVDRGSEEGTVAFARRDGGRSKMSEVEEGWLGLLGGLIPFSPDRALQ